MTQPKRYTQLNDFSDELTTAAVPGTHGAHLDQDFQLVKATTDQIINNLALIQRDDTALRNETVHPDALTTATKALIGAGNTGQNNWLPRGLWLTATVYAVGDVVENSGISYVCAVAHTSGTFATDDTAGKWITLASNLASEITYTQSGTGAVTRTIQTRLREQVSFTEFKNAGVDDYADNDAAWDLALAHVKEYGDVEIPAADNGVGVGGAMTPYLMDAEHPITRPVALQGTGGWLKLRGTGGANSSGLFNAIGNPSTRYMFHVRTKKFHCFNVNIDGNSAGNYFDYTISGVDLGVSGVGATLTLSHTSGSARTATANEATFMVGDVGAVISVGAGRATITAIAADGVTATVDITVAFADVGPHASGAWTLGPRRYYQRSGAGDTRSVGLFMVGMYGLAGADIDEILFQGCKFVDSPTHAIDSFQQGHAFATPGTWKWIRNLKIIANTFEKCQGLQIALSHCFSSSLLGNNHKDPYFAHFQWYYHNLYCQYYGNPIDFDPAGIDLTLVDPLNKIGTSLRFHGYSKLGKIETEPNAYCVYGPGNNIRGGGIYLTAGNQHCEIKGNTVHNSSAVAFQAQPASTTDVGNSVEGNTFEGSAEAGAYLADIYTPVRFHGNTLEDNCTLASASKFGGRNVDCQLMVFSRLWDLQGNTISRTRSSAISPAATLTLSDVSGSGITATASAAAFLATDRDIGAIIKSGSGVALVKRRTSDTVLTVDVLVDFASVGPIAADSWSIMRYGDQVDYGVIFGSREYFNDTRAEGNVVSGSGKLADVIIGTLGGVGVAPTVIEDIGDMNTVGELVKQFSLTALQIKALNATPISIRASVASTNPGRALIPDRVKWWLDAGATPYGGIAAAENLIIAYATDPTVALISVETIGFLDAAGDAYREQARELAITPIANDGLVVTIPTGEVIDGDGTLRGELVYRIVDVEF